MEIEIKLDSSLTARNDEIAKEISKIFDERNIFCINVMGGPGCGKTTFIEELSQFLPNLFVIQGDLKSDIDTKRLEEKGVKSFQINTHSGCHLNAHMIEEALKNINLEGVDYLLIENVGNLVCPAGVMLGQHMNLVLNSVTEGNDKPEKYPLIFKDSNAVILSKYDLKEAVEFNEEEYLERLNKVTKKPLFKISKKDKDSIKQAVDFIIHEKDNSGK